MRIFALLLLLAFALPAEAQVPQAGCDGAGPAQTFTKPFSNGGSSTSLLLLAGTANKKIRICAITMLPVAGAVNVGIVEGTTTTTPCDTGTAALAGGATAATGVQLAANGGFTAGDGIGLWAITATAADNVCLLFSAGVQVGGVFTYSVY